MTQSYCYVSGAMFSDRMLEEQKKDPKPADEAWMIIGRILAGMVLYGGIGYLLGLWLGHTKLFLAGGIVIGLIASLCLVYLRINQSDAQATRPKTVRK